jgi:lambda family phage portal protein
VANLFARALEQLGLRQASGPAPAPRARRSFSGASVGALTASWTTQDRHLNQSLLQNLRVLRARSRDLERNNDYAKQFLRMVVDNVVGPVGVALQVQAKQPDGTIDQADSDYVEAQFASWGKRANCDVARRLSWVAMQRLVLRTMARDGEVLVRRWPGRGPFGYQLQLLDPALLNEQHNEDLAGGRKIRMGVELDEFDAPIAYHLSKRPVNDPRALLSPGLDTVRVLAEQMLHLFVPEAVGQYRGVPWMATTLVRQKRLNAYQEAALAAAEEGAKKLAWIHAPEGDLSPLSDGTNGIASNAAGGTAPGLDGEPGAGTLYTDSGSVHYGMLPPGFGVEGWDPKYPEQNYGPFVTDHVRAIASGLGVAYHKLASNLEGVNYSSARAGELNERDVWIGLQSWLIDELCAPVYSEWLPLAIVSGQLRLPITKLAKFDAATWQGRRWDWVDPQKDVNAAIAAIGAKLTSRRRVMLRMGLDPDEVWAEIEAENERLGPLQAPVPPRLPPHLRQLLPTKEDQ